MAADKVDDDLSLISAGDQSSVVASLVDSLCGPTPEVKTKEVKDDDVEAQPAAAVPLIVAKNNEEKKADTPYDLDGPTAFPPKQIEAPLPSSPSDYPVPVGDVTCWKHISGIGSFFTLTWGWVVVNKAQILSGITVALAQVPEAVSFSFVAGVDPIIGLQSAWIMGICTSLFGGRPGMVAGATGAVAVVLPKLVSDYGVGYMFYAIMLAGIIQMVFGFLRLGVLVRMIPHPVMVGFCNGLGIVIGVAQFNIFKIRPEDDGDERKLFEIGGAFAPFTNGWDWVPGKYYNLKLHQHHPCYDYLVLYYTIPKYLSLFTNVYALSMLISFVSDRRYGRMDVFSYFHCALHLCFFPKNSKNRKGNPRFTCCNYRHHNF